MADTIDLHASGRRRDSFLGRPSGHAVSFCGCRRGHRPELGRAQPRRGRYHADRRIRLLFRHAHHRQLVARRACGHGRGIADGASDVGDQRHPQGRARHQRHRFVHVRAGSLFSAVQGHGWHSQDRGRFSAGQDPNTGRDPRAGRDPVSTQPAGLRCVSRRSPGLVISRQDDLGPQDKSRGAHTGRSGFAWRERPSRPLCQPYAWVRCWPGSQARRFPSRW